MSRKNLSVISKKNNYLLLITEQSGLANTAEINSFSVTRKTKSKPGVRGKLGTEKKYNGSSSAKQFDALVHEINPT